MDSLPTTPLAILLIAVCGLFSPLNGQISLPASFDFGTGPGQEDASNFVTTGPGIWKLESNSFNYESDTGLASFSATDEFLNFGGNDFIITLVLSNNPALQARFQDWSDEFGIIAGGGVAGNNGFAAVFRFNGTLIDSVLRIYEGGFGGSSFTEKTWGVAQSLEESYFMTLIGTYDGPDLNLEFTVLSENGKTETMSATLAAALYSGDYAGFGGVTQQKTIEFDTFTVVPEPSSTAVLFGALGAALMLRRQRLSPAKPNHYS